MAAMGLNSPKRRMAEESRLAKAVGFALTIGTSAAWHGLSVLLIFCLTEAERAGLAYAALRSLGDAPEG